MKIRVKFEKRDIWIGVYWNVVKSDRSGYRRLYVYICIIPFFPVIVAFKETRI